MSVPNLHLKLAAMYQVKGVILGPLGRPRSADGVFDPRMPLSPSPALIPRIALVLLHVTESRQAVSGVPQAPEPVGAAGAGALAGVVPPARARGRQPTQSPV